MLPRAPESIRHCNCSICTKSGFRGIYYGEGEVTVDGAADGYVRSDMEKPCLKLWHCPTCGVATHWTLLDHWPYGDAPRPDIMGVNARLLDPEITRNLPVEDVDGASR